jgi:hypothetical protein
MKNHYKKLFWIGGVILGLSLLYWPIMLMQGFCVLFRCESVQRYSYLSKIFPLTLFNLSNFEIFGLIGIIFIIFGLIGKYLNSKQSKTDSHA